MASALANVALFRGLDAFTAALDDATGKPSLGGIVAVPDVLGLVVGRNYVISFYWCRAASSVTAREKTNFPLVLLALGVRLFRALLVAPVLVSLLHAVLALAAARKALTTPFLFSPTSILLGQAQASPSQAEAGGGDGADTTLAPALRLNTEKARPRVLPAPATPPLPGAGFKIRL